MIQDVDDPADPRLAAFADVGDHAALRARGLFVAEGRLVLRRLIELNRFEIDSILLAPAALAELGARLRPVGCPVYVARPAVLQAVTGFDFHRGCLALAKRPAQPDPARFAAGRLLLGLEGVGNPDNVGGLFRVAAAFGADGILLDPACGDPLYRKAIRTSMGAALRVPFAHAPAFPGGLQPFAEAGFQLVAMTPSASAVPLQRFSRALQPGARLLVLFGAEGAGLSNAVLERADARVRIPVAEDVDSLNVTVAAGIALSALSTQAG